MNIRKQVLTVIETHGASGVHPKTIADTLTDKHHERAAVADEISRCIVDGLLVPEILDRVVITKRGRESIGNL